MRQRCAVKFLLFLAVLVFSERAHVLAVSTAAKRAERNYTLVAQTAEAANPKSPGLRCPTTLQYLVIGEYTNVDPQNLDKKTDALLFRNLRVEGYACNSSNYASTATIFAAAKQSPGGTPVQTAEMFFLRGKDNSARRCGPYVADLPSFYYFTDNMPLFRTRLEDEQVIPRDNKALRNARKSDIYMISQPYPPGGSDGSIVSNAVCTYLAERPENTSATNSTAKNDDNNDGSSACFPADALVRVLRARNGKTAGDEFVRMNELELGSSVLSSSNGEYSDIYLFTHRSKLVRNTFIVVETESVLSVTTNSSQLQNHPFACDTLMNSIALTPGHYMHTHPRGLIPASALRPGIDYLIRSSGDLALVTSLKFEVLQGLFAPHTLHGDIVVNDFVVSTYTTAIPAKLAHVILVPLRIAYRTTGWSVRHYFDNGSPFRI